MALTSSASCSLMSQKRSVSSLFAGRVVKRARSGPPLQEAALRLLQQNQNVEDLLTEISSNNSNTQTNSTQCQISSAVCASLLMSELKREADARSVSLTTVTVAVLVQKLKELTKDCKDELLPANTRAQLCALLESSHELLSQGALCPKLLWKELSRDEKFPKLEVAFHLHSYNITSLQYILESHAVRPWLVSELKALCSCTPSEAENQQRVLKLVLQVLVGAGFNKSLQDVPQNKRLSGSCCSILDHMLIWLLETVEQNDTSSPDETGAQTWISLLDTSLCGTLVSPEALKRYFTHCLTKTLTFKPRLTVSSAITLQNEWTFAKTSPLLTRLFCQLTVVFSMQQLFVDLQQILSTHEVNWRHVLSFLSTVLVYNPSAQTSLGELLNVLLSAAFQSFDLESVITAFLLARQGALEGPAVFASYTNWFKQCFGGSSSPHAASKKALVFLLKFLSDLVPFEPPQYLKVHILHPPFVPMKHRSLLLEYVSLAKTRLADLKESLEDMGLYEDVSAAPEEQPHCQEAQDVEKAVSLFESTGRISATVMEASIFRRPYFLNRFLPALLSPRVLPVKADARMKFIEALKKADKIPAAQYSSYVASCHREKPKDSVSDPHDSPVDVLRLQLEAFRELALTGEEGELLAQVSKVSHTLSVLCPPLSHQPAVVQLHTDSPPSDLHAQVVGLVLRSFCQCVLDTSRSETPPRSVSWTSRFVTALTENQELLSSLLHRLWDLLHNQASSLSAAHVLGLAVLMVHLHSCCGLGPQVELLPAASGPVSVTEALCSAFRLQTRAHMLLCVRFCVVAVSYNLRREDLCLDQLIPSSLYKKLLYLIPRLLPRARAFFCDEPKDEESGWKSSTDDDRSWTKSALSLWNNPAFQSLQLKPQYQLMFSEWLDCELQVCRGEDALSDPERQEYHQWACMELFLPRSEQEGGCGGDMRTLCCSLVRAVLGHSEVKEGENPKGTESCLPDILSRLQECVYEIILAERSGRPAHRDTLGSCLLELLSQRLSSTSAASAGVGTELLLQHTLRSWNRLVLALPSELFIQVTPEAGRCSVDCGLLIKHINDHQRAVCCAANLLNCHVTTHFVKGVLIASSRCGRPSDFNTAWSQISRDCPLLLVSAVFWWERLCPVLQSLWRRSSDEALPDQLTLLSDCLQWAHRVACGQSAPTPPVPAPARALLLASCLYRATHNCEPVSNDYISALKLHSPEVLVFLFALCVNHYLSSLLLPESQETSARTVRRCSALLHELVYSADWLSIFRSTERGVYQPVAMTLPDELSRLLPWAFYSLMCVQSAEFFQTAARCPGFVHTAVLCYVSLLQLFIDGHAPTHSPHQTEPSRVVVQSKTLLLSCISHMSEAALSSAQYKQLQELCAELDPELTAALSHRQNLSLSPEMDFL